MAERVCGREITNQEGNRLLRIVRRSTGSVVTWWRAQMVLLSAQGMDVAQIPRVTSPDRVRGVLHSFNLDGFDRCTRATAAAGRRPSPWPSAERSSSLPCPGRSTINCRSRRRRRTTASSTSPGDLHPPARRAALLAAYD